MPKSIRRRAFFYFTTAILVVTLAFSSLLIIYFSNTLSDRIKTDQLYATEQAAKSVDGLFDSIMLNAYYLCCNDTIASVLVNKSGLSSIAQQNQLGRTFSDTIGPLSTLLMQSADVSLLINPQFPLSKSVASNNFSLANTNRFRLYDAAFVTDTDWYQEAVRRKGQVYAFNHASNERHVFFAHQLRNIYIADPRYDDVAGVVLYAMPCARIMDILRDAMVTDGTIVLFMARDEILTSTLDSLFPAGQRLSDANRPLADIQKRGAISRLVLGASSYAASVETLSNEYKVVLLIPTTELTRHFRDLLPVFALFIAALLVIGLVLSGLFSRRLTRPIRMLSGVMLEARDSQQLLMPTPVPATKDEIAQLYESYNSMARRITALTEQAKLEEEERRAAELKALQAQINPHFIYNTLDSVACIALLSGADDIVTMVTSLIDILKYCIQFSRAKVTLREEITYLERYIRIQHLRYSDGFNFICDVPPKYDNVSISQIILQPLVENALFHAVHPKGRLEIRLYCEEKGELLLIHVADNGSNTDAEEVNHILSDAGAGERYGIGIRNVNKRIRLNMGDQYGLHYESLASGGLDAIITIPLHFD